jgi:hypothetical protein
MSVTYDTPVKLADGRYFAKASVDGGPMYVSVVNTLVGDLSDQNDLTLQVTNKTCIDEWDEVFVKDAVTNSSKWFNKEISEDVIRGYFQSSLDGTELDVQPNIDGKGKVNMTFFDQNKEIIQSVEPSTKCNVLLRFDGLWFLRKTFGPVWRLVQLRVKRVAEPVKYLIQDDDSV